MEDGISGELQHRSATCCEKGGRCGRQTCMIRKWFHHGDVVSGQVDLHMTPIQKLHPCGNIISKLYKLAFHSSHLSCNTSYGSAATIQVFCLPRWRYPYLTQSSMIELPLSVS